MRWTFENIPTIQLYLSSGFKDEHVSILIIDTIKLDYMLKVKKNVSA